MQYAWAPLILLCSLLLSNTSAAENNHTHQLQADTDTTHYHHHNDAALSLNQGEKWATDKALREGMRNIRSATHEALQSMHASETHSLDKMQAGRLAEQIHQQINNMFAQCKLSAEADAVLHSLLADMLQAAQQLESSHTRENTISEQTTSQVLRQLQNSLHLYPKYFDDNEWPID